MRTEQEATILLLNDVIKAQKKKGRIIAGINLALYGVICFIACQKWQKGA